MHRALRLAAKIASGFFAVIVTLSLFSVAFLGVAESVADETAHISPGYARVDITAVLEKEAWTPADLDLLYHQTGLTSVGLIALKGKTDEILGFQDALFRDYVIYHDRAAFTTQHDAIAGYRIVENGTEAIVPCEVPIAPLEDGDVIVSSSCHTFGWRNGHAAIITDASSHRTLECVGPGLRSAPGFVSWFRCASNFMVLRLKDRTRAERYEIALYAATHLTGIPYSILTGFFGSPKDQGDAPATTHCSHLVWQAFKYFGYDIDPDGGPVCTSRDIANSDCFEVVQVFGFDLDKLW